MRSSLAARRPALDAGLVEIVARLDRLETLVEALSRRRARVDPVADSRLVSAIAGAIGSAVFSVRDLRRHAEHDPALRASLADVGARRLGWWLRRLQGRTDGAYTLARIGRDEAGALWALSVSADHHTARRPAPHPGADSRP